MNIYEQSRNEGSITLFPPDIKSLYPQTALINVLFWSLRCCAVTVCCMQFAKTLHQVQASAVPAIFCIKFVLEFPKTEMRTSAFD